MRVWVIPCFFCSQTRECVGEVPVEPGLVTQPLSEEQWATLDRINDTLAQEYSVRRQMLLTRCDVTVQSFRWSNKAKVCRDALPVYIDLPESVRTPCHIPW